MNITNLISYLPVHPHKRYRKRNLSKVTTLVVHHGAARMSGVAKPYIRRMAIYHINKEWPGLAYHYVICPKGQVYKCNPVSSNTQRVAVILRASVSVCWVTSRCTRRRLTK
jgi:hypothetical protein